jgi:hypothetical protein
LKKRLETHRHREHGGGKREVERERYREGKIKGGGRIGLAGFGGRLSSGNSVDSTASVFQKKRLETQRHRGHGEEKKELERGWDRIESR